MVESRYVVEEPSRQRPAHTAGTTVEVEFKVGMYAQACADVVEPGLLKLDNVEEVRCNVQTKQVVVVGTDLDEEFLLEKLKEMVLFQCGWIKVVEFVGKTYPSRKQRGRASKKQVLTVLRG